jgi:hypothetical protein
VQVSVSDCWFWLCFENSGFEPVVFFMELLQWSFCVFCDEEGGRRRWRGDTSLAPSSLKHTRWIKWTTQILKSYSVPHSRVTPDVFYFWLLFFSLTGLFSPDLLFTPHVFDFSSLFTPPSWLWLKCFLAYLNSTYVTY